MRRVRPALLLAAVVVASTASPAAAYKRPGKTERISVSTSGAQVTGHNIDAAISPDGRFVVFASSASTLVPGDTNGAFDVFVRDLGAHVTERVSVASDGKEANGPSASGFSYYRAKITPGGRFVVFASDASNLVPGDTNDQTDVFVHDRLTRKTELVSAPAGGGVGDRSSVYPAISTDGRYVAFVSWATNMVPGDTNEAGDVFVRDRLAQRTERVSLATSGAEANGLSLPAFISGDGRFVAFGSSASNLVPNDNNATSDVFVRDRATGTTERVSVSVLGGNANGVSNAGGISDDGRFV
ncbi:MAG TPA: hypothetical protein VM638_07845, partial [Actinomycetota bacterium]|nr:hypothetical protein [Actinomycetota bacterium]